MQEQSLYISAIASAFQSNKSLADRAILQLPDEALRKPLDENCNSIAIIMKHVAGNLLSRWTNVLTSDGEKPDRNRDAEFIDAFRDRAEIIACWEQGWTQLFSALSSLTGEDLSRIVSIRGVPHPLPLAMARSLGHTCYHIGQIVQLARHFAGDNWDTLTIPRGQSEQFNRDHWGELGRSHS